jgi:hypothetical protein
MAAPPCWVPPGRSVRLGDDHGQALFCLVLLLSQIDVDVSGTLTAGDLLVGAATTALAVFGSPS